MQGYSSCKQNHLKICYKCAQISSSLGVKLWNVQYVEVKPYNRYFPNAPLPLSHIVINFIAQPYRLRAAC